MVNIILLPQNGCMDDFDWGWRSWKNNPDENHFGIKVKLPCLPTANNRVHLSEKTRRETLDDWLRLINVMNENAGCYYTIFSFLNDYVRKELAAARHYSDKEALEYFILGKEPDGNVDEDVWPKFEDVEILDINNDNGHSVVFDTEKNVVYIPCKFIY